MNGKIKQFIALALMLAICFCAYSLGETAEGVLYKNGQTAAEFRSGAQRDTGVQLPNVVYFDNLTSMLLALKSGRIARMIIAEPSADYIAARNDDVVSARIPAVMYLSMAAREQDEALLSALNEAIRTLTEDGTIDEIYQKSIQHIAEDPEPADMPAIEGARTVRVVVTGDLPPMDFMTAGNAAAGFNVELLSAIGTRAGIQFELVMADAGSRAAMVASGRADAVFWMESFRRTDENGTIYAFSESCEGLALTDAYLEIPVASMTCK